MTEPRRRHKVTSAALLTVKVVGMALFGYGVLMFVAQRRVLFPGTSRTPLRAEAVVPPGVTQVWLEPSFGRVEAWHFQAAGDAPGSTVVFAHGNGELIDDWGREMDDLRAAGVSVLLVEFPGYGFSEGVPSRHAIRETFAAAYDWLVDEAGAVGERVVAYGRSLGGGAASDLALDRPVGALVLQSTFTSTASMARQMLLPGFLVRDRFDNLRAVAAYGGPVLLMHGRADDVVSYEHAERLAGARPGLEVIDLDCAHNDCGSEWPFILAALKGFLGTHGLFGGAGGGASP